MSQAAKKMEQKEELRQLPMHGLKYGEYEQAHIVVRVTDNATTPEEVCRPEYWANHGEHIKKMMIDKAPPRIDVYWTDGSKVMELLVVGADRQYAHVVVKSLTELKKPEEFFKSGKAESKPTPVKTVKQKQNTDEKKTDQDDGKIKDANDPENYKLKYISPSTRWGVLRLSDNSMLTDGLEDKADAQKWLDEYLKAL